MAALRSADEKHEILSESDDVPVYKALLALAEGLAKQQLDIFSSIGADKLSIQSGISALKLNLLGSTGDPEEILIRAAIGYLERISEISEYESIMAEIGKSQEVPTTPEVILTGVLPLSEPTTSQSPPA